MWKRDAIFRIHITNEEKSRDVEISKSSFVIGRNHSSDFQIEAPSISRSHLQVELLNGEIWIKDLGSAGGTKVNGRKLEANESEVYRAGDAIILGLNPDVLTFNLVKSENASSSNSNSRPLRFNNLLDKVKDATIGRFSEATVVDRIEATEIKSKPESLPLPEEVLAEAKASALKIKISAETEAAKTIQEAKEKALSELASAKEKAQNIISGASDKAMRLEKESEADSAKIRLAMQDTIAKVQSESEKKAEVFLNEAREKAAQTIQVAHEKGKATLADYQASAEKLLSEVRVTVTATKVEAQKEADAVLSQAYQKTADLKNALESEIKVFQEGEKKKSEEYLAATEKEADFILQEARRASSMIRAQVEKELGGIKKNAEQEAKNSAAKIIALAKEQGEKQKLEILQGAIEEATKIKDEASREAKKEALTLLKNAENDRSGLTKNIEKLNQDILLQEKKKTDHADDIKALQKKNSDLKDQFEKLAAKLVEVEGETNKKTEEFRGKIISAEALLATRVAEADKQKQESHRAESLTKNSLEERDKLTKVIENLKQQETQLTKSLKVSTQQIETEKLRLREAAEKEMGSFKNDTNAEIKGLRDKAMAEFNQRKADQEAELSKMRVTELETIKGMRAEEEERFKASRNHQVLEIAKALETYLVPRISKGLETDRIFPELKTIVKKILDEQFSVKVAGFGAKKRKKVYIGLGLGFAAAIALFFVIRGEQGTRKSASDLFIERIREKEAQKPKFAPQITDEYKGSYTDNVIYTKDYVDFKLNQDNQSKWINSLNKFFVKDLGLNENAIVKFISIESSLVNQLKDSRAVIHYENQNEDIQKMRDLEKDSAKEMIEVLGTQEKYSSFREFEKKYYLSNREPASITPKTP